MKSVRLRLLLLALLPLSVLMPLMLILAMTRWNADYDAVLIAKVDSDLRIAEQYLGHLQTGTANSMLNLAQSTAFQAALNDGSEAVNRLLESRRQQLQLDFLEYMPLAELEEPQQKWPVIRTAATGQLASEIDIFSADDMSLMSPALQKRASITLIETEAAAPTTRKVEDRGMVVHTAAPVIMPGHNGVLRGGLLLNRNLDFIDTLNALVYLSDEDGGNRQGTATLFLEDTRVSTNVRLFEDVRALGTRVSAVVRRVVLEEGRTWLNRAFVVNDWYISGYLPLTDSFGERVGMLYVGFLEAPYMAAKSEAYWTIVGAFLMVLALSAPLFLWLAKGIFSPLERMTVTMKRVERGDLTARNGDVGSGDEIGQVASHLDTLLDQLQDRDQKLREWAGELNARVDQRTAELRAANQKLEDTYKQLVMSEKLASIGEITAGVAHEINNPVAVIQGNVDVMRMTLGPGAAEVKTELDLIDNQVMRIGAIVSKLLQFARPSEFGTFKESVDIANVVTDCLVLVDHVLSKHNIVVDGHFDVAPAVRIDPGELQQVIINLVINAAQAMKETGTLTLTLKAEERDGTPGACLTVADSGPGISEDHISEVFNPFYTTKPGEGTGLGLSISQTLIQHAGGIITVRNRAEGGAAFAIWLPERRD
ncbi:MULTISPECIES: sensor histidine kinase [Rhodobacterales]|uniref:sensor histidine kinase n=1 Tax=Rhodobacterales TaxID=204455 RepID=UPI00237F67C3|nr:cache domain-containing protein [Phaeobacter gallaeciensis]MDE4140429.1 cache domain-containing protein [Phaeobacter gallaeciensis]MDE4148878.1 cache domain-containing protein [Phaeobacter gallaeciensis]MDE4153100.1 cache domain-containing protein [Phaeobacter gallaeciensis]MDE4228486.1 cache domain-containing protein [Phaeobacter gallaeciensis]MDE4257562.1 cache domain-containing protein [Phaeobacter gallaeciensis]